MTAPAPKTEPAKEKLGIKSGTGIAKSNSYITLETGKIYYVGAGVERRGMLYTSDPEIEVGNRSPGDDPSSCEETKAYSYSGISNICEFANPDLIKFIPLTSAGIRFYDKTATGGGYKCGNGIMTFRQGGVYGAIDFEDVDSENNLRYTYWIDQSGKGDFRGLCSPQSFFGKVKSILANIFHLLF